MDTNLYADSYNFIAEIAERNTGLSNILLDKPNNKNICSGVFYKLLFTSGLGPLRYDLTGGMCGHDNMYLGLRLLLQEVL